MTSHGRARLDRRSFLLALGVVPVATALVACSKESAPKQLHGPDLSGVDDTVRIQDDLFRHMNGKWLKDYQLPPDKTSFSTFDEVSDRVLDQLRTVIDGIKDPKDGTTGQQIRDIYDARMDLDAIEKLGMSPLQPMFSQIDGAATKSDLAKVMGALPLGGLMGLSISIDRKNSNAYLPSVSQSGIGMSEQYYRKPEF
ncbi:M13 family peptidase, partial [Nocardia gipuzkoensis]